MNSVFRSIIALLFLMAGAVTLRAQEPKDEQSMNMTLLDHIEPISTSEAGGLHNSCWGYTAPDGREYALFGTQVGTYIIDITEIPVKEVAFIRGPYSVWRNIKTYKQYAYISTENREEDQTPGLQIVDLSTLPDTATLIRTDTNTLLSAHTLWIADNYLYAMGTKAEAEANGGAVILDLEPDPTMPRRVGAVAPYYYHDAFVRNDTLVGAAINGEGCDIYDVTDKANPKRIATFSYPFSGTHNTALTQDGSYVLTSDEVGFTTKTLKVWDIRDPDDIVMVAEYTPNLAETIHNIRVKGRYAYVAWYTAGVRVIDMIDPTHPREVAHYDTFLGDDGGFNGAWEVYPYFPSGKVVASDRNSGLYVLQFNGAEAGSVSGVVRDSKTGEPIRGVSLTMSETGKTIRSDAAGRYYFGVVKGDNVSIRAEAFGYEDGIVPSRTITGDETADILLDSIPLRRIAVRLENRLTGAAAQNFSYAVPPYIESTPSNGDVATILLPEGREYNLIVGTWGLEQQQLKIPAAAGDEEIVVQSTPGYQDDATLRLGWSYESPEDNATTGRWHRIQPYLGYPRSEWVHPDAEPAGTQGYIFFTGSPPKFAPPERDDISNGRTTLTSPEMDLSSYGDPMVVFDLWFVQFERDTIRDTLIVELSNNGGATWQSAYREVKGKAGWNRHVLFVRDHLPPSDRMIIRFRASDTLGNILTVAGMDNFEVVDRVFSGVHQERTSIGGHDGLRLFPNPSHGEMTLSIESKGERISVELLNILGQRVRDLHSGYLPEGRNAVPITLDVSSGEYFLRVSGPNGTRMIPVTLY